MRNNQTLYSIILFAILGLLSVSGIINIFLTNNNEQLQKQLELRDKTINEINIADSILCSESMRNSETLEKYINNCSFILNGEIITSEELILYSQQIMDSLNIYRAFHNFTKKSLKVDYNISQIDNRMSLTMDVPQDSLLIFKALYETAVNKYGFDFEISIENNDLIILNNFSKADSAMYIYEYYKNNLIKDEKGRWMLIVQKK